MDDRADGRDGVFKPHGKADVGQPLAVPCRKQGARLPEGKPLQLCRAAKEPVSAQPAAEQLAEHGGNGGAVHPHAQRHDEKVVQQNVHHAGDQQEIKRVLGIPQRPQHAGGVVIQHRSRDAQKNEPDVEHGIGVQLLRRMDEPEQRPCHQGGEHGEHHAQHQTEQCAVQQVFLQSVLILCAKGLCRRDAKAHAGTLHKAQNEKVEGVGGAHRAQRIGAQTPPDDDGVRKAVQLLEQGAQHQRQGEPQDLEQRLAHGKVGGAGALLRSSCHKENSLLWYFLYSTMDSCFSQSGFVTGSCLFVTEEPSLSPIGKRFGSLVSLKKRMFDQTSGGGQQLSRGMSLCGTMIFVARRFGFSIWLMVWLAASMPSW